MNDQSKHILNLSDSDFLSFLYSERDRENNLSQFQGWNNWALFGAIIAVLCAGFEVIKDNYNDFHVISIVYYVSGFLALFLAYRSYSRIIKRERGIDFAKVRMLKEVIPYVRIILVFVSSISFTLLILIFDKVNKVFFIWTAIILLYLVGILIAVFNRARVVPSYYSYSKVLFPWPKANIAFDAIVGGLLGLTGSASFRVSPYPFSYADFELAACISFLVILLYLFFVINTENKVVKRFDAIIDAYLYLGASKDETYQQIMRNRMGYSVLESCYNEYKAVEKEIEKCKNELNELDGIIQGVAEGAFKMQDLCVLRNRVDEIVGNQKDANKQSKRLNMKTSQILKAEPVLKDLSELEELVQANQRYLVISNTIFSRAREAYNCLYNAEMGMLNELDEACMRLKDD